MDIISKVKDVASLLFAETDRVLCIDRTLYNGEYVPCVLFSEQPSFIDINEGVTSSLPQHGAYIVLEKFIDGVLLRWTEEVNDGEKV